MKKYTRFRPLILSRHPSHSPLRRENNKDPNFLLPFRSVVRFGSTTETKRERIELNSIEAIKNSSSKLRMKQCFSDNNVLTAKWWLFDRNTNRFISKMQDKGTSYSIEELPYPIVAKTFFGSRGKGNQKIDNVEQMQSWIRSCSRPNDFLFEVFHNYCREYRLHVTKDGCFYSCRKMLRTDTPEGDRWYRNDKNSVWILESNDNFDKPTNWDEIEKECVKALKAVGLDFGAVDLRVQSSKSGPNPRFVVIEINSAPSFGTITQIKYKEIIPKLLKDKYSEQKTFNRSRS